MHPRSIGPLVILIALLRGLPAGALPGSPPTLQVLRADEAGLVLEFRLPEITRTPVTIEGTSYVALTIEGGGHAGAPGEPMLPTFARLVQIPADAEVSLEVTALDLTELGDQRPLPQQPEGSSAFVIRPEAYSGSGLPPADRVTTGRPAYVRNLRLVPLIFHPVRYTPQDDRLQIARRMVVQVSYQEAATPDPPPGRAELPMTHSFDRLFRALVVNYAPPGGDRSPRLGSYLLICPDIAAVVDALAPLVEWRTRQGYQVYLATTGETGTSREAIRDWILNAYHTWENPPEYVTLVGDATGGIAIPCWTGYGGESDLPYVDLVGNDLLTEAHIGRISVNTVDQLQLYVNKIVGYESAPHMAATDWFQRACVVGDPSASGYTCVQIMQWLKTRLLEQGYTEVDTIFGGPWVSQMIASLNSGTSVFSYRGYYGMSGLDPADILSLQNGPKMPFAVNLTCGTGSFASTTSHSEAWIRAGVPPDTPTGGIASIGTATLNTHTRYNNCVTYGVWQGVLREGLHCFGAALTRGRWELYINYGEGDPSGFAQFAYWNNLMGDAAGEIWTGVPQPMTVEHPAEIAVGANTVTIVVREGDDPLPDARVCLWIEDTCHSSGQTSADGSLELPVTTPLPGAMKVTVTRHDYLPYLASLPIVQLDRHLGYYAHVIDDDESGQSSGNGDGLANPTEEIELWVEIVNTGTEPITAPQGTLICDDPLVTVLDADAAYADIPPGAHTPALDPFAIRIAGDAPCDHLLRFGLDLTSGGDVWHALIEVPVVAAAFVYADHTLYGCGATLDPGEAGGLGVRIANAGNAPAAAVTGTLVATDPWITVTNGTGSFGTLPVGASGENTSQPFGLQVSHACYQGHQALLQLALAFSGGAADTLLFALPIGVPAAHDPTGPDQYGYCAFDNGDIGYTDAPTYDWVELDPNHGGSGTALGLGDDASVVVDLPFPFTYYGETFTRATVCSNGWLAMGATYLTNYRNWNIPAAGAPNFMIAPMWDNLFPQGGNTVYHWYDADSQRYIVQWSRMLNAAGLAPENFELILYDPAAHPTASGDGMIVFQYETFNNTDFLQQYCTVGIENGDQTDGLMYSYFNAYNTGAALIDTGRAIKFVPADLSPRGLLTGSVVNLSNGSAPLPGASLTLLESGERLTTGSDGTYSGAVHVGTYTLTASHPSFTADTVWVVTIEEEQITRHDFALTDILPPAFLSTTVYHSTPDQTGPYEIFTRIEEYSSLEDPELRYNPGGHGWLTLPLELYGGWYRAAIPGQPYITQVEYYLYARDGGGLEGYDPLAAPDSAYSFWVLPPLIVDNMEEAGGWTHEVVTAGFMDEWHHSDYRDHTPSGSWSWHVGGPQGEDYGPFADGALISEPIPLVGYSLLTFWHWIDAEDSYWWPPYAYDGGIVEISVAGGAWTQIFPEGGYPNLIRIRDEGPGPFPAELPLYSGTDIWREARFEIENVTGMARLRFRFGSDYAGTGEGWYIDDLELITSEPDLAGIEDSAGLPRHLVLHPCTPNPWRDSGGTEIRFDLPQAARTRVKVFDAGGRLVRTLLDGSLPPGHHRVLWDGRDGGLRPLGSGVYFYRLEAGDQARTRRTLILH